MKYKDFVDGLFIGLIFGVIWALIISLVTSERTLRKCEEDIQKVEECILSQYYNKNREAYKERLPHVE